MTARINLLYDFYSPLEPFIHKRKLYLELFILVKTTPTDYLVIFSIL